MRGFWDWIKSGFASVAGSPADRIDCQQVMAQLYEYIDRELHDPQVMEQIRRHLQLCKKCYPRYHFEKAFLEFLAEQARNPAPPDLRQKVFQRILEEEHSE